MTTCVMTWLISGLRLNDQRLHRDSYSTTPNQLEPRCEKTGLRGPTRSDTNQAVQPQKIVRGLKFQIKVVEGLYCPYSENKGADQLRDYREADLRLCFRIICKKPVFLEHGSLLV